MKDAKICMDFFSKDLTGNEQSALILTKPIHADGIIFIIPYAGTKQVLIDISDKTCKNIFIFQ